MVSARWRTVLGKADGPAGRPYLLRLREDRHLGKIEEFGSGETVGGSPTGTTESVVLPGMADGPAGRPYLLYMRGAPH